MPRPIKWRNVSYLPEHNRFGPLNKNRNKDYFITMTVEEYETIRLIDLENMKQEGCAKQMNIARTTVQSIYASARGKIADSIVNGKTIIIEGGNYRLYNNENLVRREFGRGNGRGLDSENGCRNGREFDRENEINHRNNFQNNKINEMEVNSMKIAIPVDENKIESNVSFSFGRTTSFLIYDVESKKCLFLDNSAQTNVGGAGIKASQVLVDNKINILLTPRCGENAEAVLTAGDIKIYKTKYETAKENIDAYLKGDLAILGTIHSGFHNHE